MSKPTTLKSIIKREMREAWGFFSLDKDPIHFEDAMAVVARATIAACVPEPHDVEPGLRFENGWNAAIIDMERRAAAWLGK